MAFHVACPITCRRICFCALGFPLRLHGEKCKNEFLQEVDGVEQFLNDPWLIKAKENATVQVEVPKVVSAAPLPPPPQIAAVVVGGEKASMSAASAQVKRSALQKHATAASMVAEDYARRFKSGDLTVSEKDAAGEEQGPSKAKVMCRLCFSGENEGSERARKMLSCNSCGKKYHRSCLKAWSQHRDLFHWSSWTCPSCRTCEVCQKTGDPNKFMFCKRCDGAFHCYCQQPPHKNVGHGPYLCPKHTKCHSCGSSVPGNGLSVRWFLGYTCCDACGRLFVKGNYCPVCLKVYRDSESTPMVCCDICQHWVHCPCDGISDAKYMQFQVDRNLQYVCPTCRGESCQVKNLEDAVQELWRRRDESDKDLIACLRAAAGLPTQEEIFDISPFLDDEESEPLLLKNEKSHSFKFSLKGLGDKSPRKNKEYGKKSSKKKKKGKEASFVSGTDSQQSFGGQSDGDNKNDEVAMAGGTKTSRTIKIKSNKNQDLSNTQGPKLVIHLGGRNRNMNSPSRSEASSYKKGEDLTSSNVGTEDTGQLKNHEYITRTNTTTKSEDKTGHKTNHSDQVRSSKLREKEGHLIKFKNVSSEISNNSSKLNQGEFPDNGPSVSGDYIDDNSSLPSISQASSKDLRPYLRFKIPKNSNNGIQNADSNLNSGNEDQNPVPLSGKEDITYRRGQRSKRRRPAFGDEDNTIKEFTDANWILQKLGKDSAGKRVEIHQPSDNTWHRGTVTDIFEGTSMVSVALDDGQSKNYELGKQGIRFVPQKLRY